jgi:hypothetical protein
MAAAPAAPRLLNASRREIALLIPRIHTAFFWPADEHGLHGSSGPTNERELTRIGFIQAADDAETRRSESAWRRAEAARRSRAVTRTDRIAGARAAIGETCGNGSRSRDSIRPRPRVARLRRDALRNLRLTRYPCLSVGKTSVSIRG